MLSAKAANRKDLSAKPATMTHQHYRAIAAILRDARTWTRWDADMRATLMPELARAFADKLADTNPNFDRARFIAACQPTEG